MHALAASGPFCGPARAHRGDRGLRGRMDVRIPRALARESRGRSAPAVALLVYLATFIYLCVVAMTLWLSGAVLVESCSSGIPVSHSRPAQDITELKGAGQGPDGCRIGCLA